MQPSYLVGGGAEMARDFTRRLDRTEKQLGVKSLGDSKCRVLTIGAEAYSKEGSKYLQSYLTDRQAD
jgi:hypothetical protein